MMHGLYHLSTALSQLVMEALVDHAFRVVGTVRIEAHAAGGVEATVALSMDFLVEVVVPLTRAVLWVFTLSCRGHQPFNLRFDRVLALAQLLARIESATPL